MLTVKPLEEISENQRAAQELHARIMCSGQLAASSLVEFCKLLKDMRDSKLYLELGYDSFDTYAEGAVGIKQRQAYSYISTYESLGSTVLQSNANLGITKLALLAQVNPIEREEFTAQNDMAEMSVRELKEAVAKLNAAEEQISFLQKSNESLSDEAERIKSENIEEQSRLQCEINRLNEEISKLEKQTPSASDEDIKKAVDAAVKKEKQSASKKLNEVEQNHKKELDEVKESAAKDAKKQIAELEEKKRKAEEKLAEVMKEAKRNSADPQLIEINFNFQQLQATANKLETLIDVYGKVNAEKAAQVKTAVSKVLSEFIQKHEVR